MLVTVQVLKIEARQRQGPGALASLADFTLSDGDWLDDDSIITQPNVSLYCFDDATRRAIFVELPDDIDLSNQPFVYRTQFLSAQHLLAVSYETFRAVAQTLPPVQNLIVIYISGRSGSTLLSHVFNALDNVLSLSEPDISTQFVLLRAADGSRDAELRVLLDCAVRILFKPTPFKQADTFALKFRSETLQVMDLYHATFPQARNLFLYRDALGFAASFYRIFKRANFPDSQTLSDFVAGFSEQFNQDLSGADRYLDADTEQISTAQMLGLWWLIIMEAYLRQAARGIPILPVRYADLNAHREQVLAAIFTYCGLPTEQVAQTLSVFEHDSQAGSFLARENPSEGNALRLTDEQIAEITTILARHPVINVPDFIVPATLTL
jgi:hypothetical protein